MKTTGNDMRHAIFLLLFASYSCSRINVESRDAYQKKNMRHGIVPLSSGLDQKMKEASIERGKYLYQTHCLSCHGSAGQGDGPEAQKLDRRPTNLRTLVRDVPNFTFFMSISQWQGDMPGWKEPFNGADREDLVAYIKTFR